MIQALPGVWILKEADIFPTSLCLGSNGGGGGGDKPGETCITHAKKWSILNWRVWRVRSKTAGTSCKIGVSMQEPRRGGLGIEPRYTFGLSK